MTPLRAQGSSSAVSYDLKDKHGLVDEEFLKNYPNCEPEMKLWGKEVVTKLKNYTLEK